MGLAFIKHLYTSIRDLAAAPDGMRRKIMDCAVGLHITDLGSIGRIALISSMALAGMFIGYIAVERVSKDQANENNKHIDYLIKKIETLMKALERKNNG